MEKFENTEILRLIARKDFFFAILSYASILGIFSNLSLVHSPLVGAIASITYLLVNGTLLGRVFMKKESLFFRLTFGILLLIMVLGFVGWVVMIAYNLDIIRSMIALCIVSTLSIFMGLKAKPLQLEQSSTVHVQRRAPSRLRIVSLVYLFMIILSFYLLFMSRTEEARTVWEVMQPAFLPVFFGATFLLFMVISSSERLEYKLLFVILHSILTHTFFVIIFPAGDILGQQMVLGRTRLVYENVSLHGIAWPMKSILMQIYLWFRGDSFQTVLSVIFARMLNVDVMWSHLLLTPFLWGTFVPLAAFMVTKSLSGKENISVVSSLLVSSFPATILWGAMSVPNSLGFIFFSYSLIFFLKYLFSDESKASLLMATFSFFSLLCHYLTGIMSFSLLLLAVVLKTYEDQKDKSPLTARVLLLVSFIFCASLVPLALVYLKLFYPIYTYFSLNKFYEFPTIEMIKLFVFGEYIHLSLRTALAYGLGPLLGFFGMLFYWRRGLKQGSNEKYRVCTLYFLMAILVFTATYEVVKLFMIRVPFSEERIWVFRDFVSVPFVAIVTSGILSFLGKKVSNITGKVPLPKLKRPHNRIHVRTLAAYILVLVALSGWVTASVYLAYPHYGPLQTTSYELEAVKYIDETTSERYIVICDQWMIFAGETIVGVGNPRAFYFSHWDYRGVALFIEMKNNPSPDPLIKAMDYNNATVAYFIIEKPRLGTEEYNRIKSQAIQNGLQTCRTFYYKGEEKLSIFSTKKNQAMANR